MISKEILKKIRRIQITTSRMVSDVFAGQYHSVFKGRGIEFEEVREYMPGDEIRSIDWNVTARYGKPFVKQFIEERELTVMLALDLSGSLFFGSANILKRELAAEICGLLAFSAIKNNDTVGFAGFAEKVEKFVPARKGLSHVLRVVREALYFKPAGIGTNINAALEHINRVCRRKAVVFVISDFFCPDVRKQLAVTRRRHDVIAITITDPRELQLPSIGLVRLSDAETGIEYTVDTSAPSVRAAYAEDARRRVKERDDMFRQMGIDAIDVRTDIPYAQPLVRFFRRRAKRLR